MGGDSYDFNELKLQRAIRSFRNSQWTKKLTGKNKLTRASIEQTVHAIFKQFHSSIEEPMEVDVETTEETDEPDGETSRRPSALELISNNMTKGSAFSETPAPTL